MSETAEVSSIAPDHVPYPLGINGKLIQISLDPKVPFITDASDPLAMEHYRRLRTKLLQQQYAKPFKTVVVTSPSPKEGKTVTVLNLGLTCAMLPAYRVLVIDGDMRRGSLSQALGVDNVIGFSNLIDGTARVEDVVLRARNFPMNFVSRGTSGVASAELLQSYEFKSKLEELSQYFSLILIDSPPANLLTDVQLIASNSDAVLLVARAFYTSKKTFQKALQDVSAFRIIGTVLNGGTRPSAFKKYQGYYDYYGGKSDTKLLCAPTEPKTPAS